MLDLLNDNGGPTRTHALRSGSPARNSGDASLVAGVGNTPATDQRGGLFERVIGAAIDIGSFEAPPPPERLAADFDGDGDVDGHDFLSWQQGDGDANGDFETDQQDLNEWTRSFGEVLEPAPEAMAIQLDAELPPALAAAAAAFASETDATLIDDPERTRDESLQAAFAALPVRARVITTSAGYSSTATGGQVTELEEQDEFEVTELSLDEVDEALRRAG
jgi:hypothetical protein